MNFGWQNKIVQKQIISVGKGQTKELHWSLDSVFVVSYTGKCTSYITYVNIRLTYVIKRFTYVLTYANILQNHAL